MLDERPVPVKKLAARVIDGEAVLLTTADSRLHRLNETGTLLWQLIERGASVSQMVDTLCAEYEITAQQAEQDVTALLQTMIERGIVELR